MRGEDLVGAVREFAASGEWRKRMGLSQGTISTRYGDAREYRMGWPEMVRWRLSDERGDGFVRFLCGVHSSNTQARAFRNGLLL